MACRNWAAARSRSGARNMARRNLKIGEKAYQRHSERKEYYGLTWEQYLDAGCPDIPPEDRDG